MKKHKIFIVDDSYVFRSLVKKSLHTQNYEVFAEASNGIEALEKYKTMKPDIFIIDVKMPEMNGLELIEKILMINPKQKILAVIVENTKQEIEKAKNSGALEVLIKPFQPAFLFTKLEKILTHEFPELNDNVEENQEIQNLQTQEVRKIPQLIPIYSNEASLDWDEDEGDFVITIPTCTTENDEILEIINDESQIVFDEETTLIIEETNKRAFDELKGIIPSITDSLPIEIGTETGESITAKDTKPTVSIRAPQDYRYKLINEEESDTTESLNNGDTGKTKATSVFKKLFKKN